MNTTINVNGQLLQFAANIGFTADNHPLLGFTAYTDVSTYLSFKGLDWSLMVTGDANSNGVRVYADRSHTYDDSRQIVKFAQNGEFDKVDEYRKIDKDALGKEIIEAVRQVVEETLTGDKFKPIFLNEVNAILKERKAQVAALEAALKNEETE